jgi:hypothetical protein
MPRAREKVGLTIAWLLALSEVIGADLLCEIDRKMEINRKRVWRTDGTGHGYHVRKRGTADV